MRGLRKLVCTPAFFVWVAVFASQMPVAVQAQTQIPATPADLPAVAVSTSAFDLRIEAPKDVQEVLQRHLELTRFRALPDIDDGELERLARAAEQDARSLLGTLGYFSASVVVHVRAADKATKSARIVRVTVDPGAATTVSGVELTFQGAVNELAPAVVRRDLIRGGWSLRTGMRFTQAHWDDAKALALRQLAAQDFPMARISSSRADIDPDTRTARLSMTLDSGPAYRLGALQVDGLKRFDTALVERIAQLKPGSAYDQTAMLEAQQRLQDSAYFDSVFLSLQTEADPAAAPVLVTLREAIRNTLVLGVGASTDSGARVSVEHTNHQLPVIGWRAASRLVLDRDNQLVGTALTSTPDAGNWRWLASVQLKNDDASDVQVQSQNLRLGRTKAVDHIDRNYYMEYDRTRSTDAGRVTRAQSISASYSWTQRNFDSLPFPASGHGLGAELGGGVTLGGQRDPFLRAQIQWLGVWPLQTQAGRITARAQGGAVLARDSAVLPSTQLFLTGGDTTVRGYAFHAIGATSASGQTTPGRFMFNGGIEWQRPIIVDGQASGWENTLFIDAGSVADRRADFKARVGIGTGARWRSPVGPLQMDLAYGLATRQLRLHLTVGFTF